MEDRHAALIMAAMLYPHMEGHEYERKEKAAALALDLVAEVFKAWDADERVGQFA